MAPFHVELAFGGIVRRVSARGEESKEEVADGSSFSLRVEGGDTVLVVREGWRTRFSPLRDKYLRPAIGVSHQLEDPNQGPNITCHHGVRGPVIERRFLNQDLPRNGRFGDQTRFTVTFRDK
jgi:hypothetical protein